MKGKAQALKHACMKLYDAEYKRDGTEFTPVPIQYVLGAHIVLLVQHAFFETRPTRWDSFVEPRF